ncbi:MAG: hypothetical protein EP330_25525 [Deltaproteobacteria bacterium]|nr:MAG: hypothetical protein EP330_25525 [Deltaproteobacteria bacterium]
MHRPLFLAALAIAALTGCEEIASQDLQTDEISAEMLVFATGDGQTTAESILRTGGLNGTTFVELTGADRFTVSREGADGPEEVELNAEDLVALHRYRTVFDGDEPNQEYTFDLDREVDAGAPSSTASLPEAFDLDALPETVGAAETVTITWSPSGTSDEMALRVEGPCIATYREELDADSGSVTFDTSVLEPNNTESPESCTLEFQLSRVRVGTADTAWDEAFISGQQQRTADTLYSP